MMVTNSAIAFTRLFLPLYPYPYKIFAFIVTTFAALLIFLPIFGIYRLIVRKFGSGAKRIIDLSLKIAGITLLNLFILEGAVTLITIYQINTQLGFNYATPGTPEGELFIITRVNEGKTMDLAGLKTNDEVQMWNTGDLYRLLMNNQGKIVSFQVVRDKTRMTITVMVPWMKLPLKQVVVWF